MLIAPAAATNALHLDRPTSVDAPAPPAPPAPAPTFDKVFDFPTLAAGQAFRVARGSTFNGIGVSGDAKLEALSPNAAKVWIKAGTFFLKKEALLSVEQTGPSTATITIAEPASTPRTINGTIVDVRTNYSEFVSADPAATGGAKLQVDPSGRLIVDVEGGVLAGLLGIDAKIHLVLEKA